MTNSILTASARKPAARKPAAEKAASAKSAAQKPAQKSAKKAGRAKAPGWWNTKYGPRRVREEMPTIEEAIFAARGLTDDEHAQVEIAASLIEMPAEEVRKVLLKTKPPRREAASTIAFTGRPGAERSVVVERKPSRRPLLQRSASSL